jgi:hypothetical protein
MQQTDNAQRTANAPPYATARLPLPLTPYDAASTYLAAYQQQLLESTSPGSPLQQLRTCNILNIIIIRYRYVSSYLKIDYTDYRPNFKHARPRLPYIYVEHTTYKICSTKYTYSVMRRAGDYFLPQARTRHVRSSTECTGKYVPQNYFQERGLQIIFLSTRTSFLQFTSEFYQEVGFVDVRNSTRYY